MCHILDNQHPVFNGLTMFFARSQQLFITTILIKRLSLCESATGLRVGCC